MVLLEVSLVVNAINSHVVGSLSDVNMTVNISHCIVNVFRHKDLSTLVLYFVPSWFKFGPETTARSPNSCVDMDPCRTVR